MEKMKYNTKSLSLVLAFAFGLPVFGIVMHPGGEPSPAWSEKPSSNVIGRWGSNASCTVISADCVVTTVHQGGGVGTNVVIGGKSYKVTRIENFQTSDIRVAKLRYADLVDYVSLYTGESEEMKTFVMGGYGQGRGTELQTSGITYGYMWDGSANTTVRWCTNYIDSKSFMANSKDIKNPHPLLEADFDGPGLFATEFEGTLANYDSGGGWFIKSGSTWMLIGISYTVTTHGGSPSQSWFKNKDTLQPSPDKLYAHRVSSYATWIDETKAKLADCGSHPEDITEDCKVDIDDIKELAVWWASAPNSSSVPRREADVNSDNAVNMLDFAKIAAKWNENYW